MHRLDLRRPRLSPARSPTRTSRCCRRSPTRRSSRSRTRGCSARSRTRAGSSRSRTSTSPSSSPTCRTSCARRSTRSSAFPKCCSSACSATLNEKQDDYLKDIHSSGQHLLKLINDILDLSKVEAGRMELELSTFDLPSAISNAMTLIRERAQRHGIALGIDVDPAARRDRGRRAQVQADPAQPAVQRGQVHARRRAHRRHARSAAADDDRRSRCTTPASASRRRTRRRCSRSSARSAATTRASRKAPASGSR